MHRIAITAVFVFLNAPLCHAQEAQVPEKEEKARMARVLCVESLSKDEEEVLLGTKTEDGKFKQYGEITLRSPFIGDWVPVPIGVSHILLKKGEEFVSIGSFTIDESQRRTILVLLPDVKNNTYRIQVIDPTKLDFRKGQALIINYGNLQAVVKIDDRIMSLKPGELLVERIDANTDDMHRLLIGHVDKDKNITPCYDHFISSNPNTRKIILLFPDPNTGLRAMSLSEFGPFE